MNFKIISVTEKKSIPAGPRKRVVQRVEPDNNGVRIAAGAWSVVFVGAGIGFIATGFGIPLGIAFIVGGFVLGVVSANPFA